MDGLELIHEAQERDRKDLLQPRLRSAQIQSEPSPDQRFVGVRAHGRSECEEARSSALPFRANRRESAVLEVGPTQRPPLAPQRDSVALCWPEKKAEKKRTELGEVVVL